MRSSCLFAVLLAVFSGCGASSSDDHGGVGGAGGAGGVLPQSGICGGSFRVSSGADDLAAVAQCTSITGDLSISAFPSTTFSLPILESVGGKIEIAFNNTLVEATFPALKTVSGDLMVFRNDALTSLLCPVLESVGGSESVGGVLHNLEIYSNTTLVNLGLPMLASVGGYFEIKDSALTSLDLSALAIAGSFEFSNDVALTRLTLPVLASAGLKVDGDNVLASLTLPVLATADSIEISGNAALTTLSLPVLKKVTFRFTITNNPALPTCQAQAVQSQLLAAPSKTDLTNNDDMGTCP